MWVTIRLFAGAAQIAETSLVRIYLDNGAMTNLTVLVRDVAKQLASDFPQLRNLLKNSRWASGDEFVGLDFVVEPEHTLALIPPVSGG